MITFTSVNIGLHGSPEGFIRRTAACSLHKLTREHYSNRAVPKNFALVVTVYRNSNFIHWDTLSVFKTLAFDTHTLLESLCLFVVFHWYLMLNWFTNKARAATASKSHRYWKSCPCLNCGLVECIILNKWHLITFCKKYSLFLECSVLGDTVSYHIMSNRK